MKKLTAILMALLLTAAVATGCAKDEVVTDNDVQTETEAPAEDVTEEETLDKLSNIIDQIVVSERQLRESIIKSDELCDRIARAEGVFRYAKMISSSEFMKLYADLRLGVSTDIIRGISYEKLDCLLVNVMPANLMLDSEQLSADEKQRDKLRAEKIRTIIG